MRNKDEYSFKIYNDKGQCAKQDTKIIVELPEYHVSMENHEFYISRKVVLAQVKLRLSGGLYLKILKIIEDDADGQCDNPLKPGDYKQFRRTRCKWRLASLKDKLKKQEGES